MSDWNDPELAGSDGGLRSLLETFGFDEPLFSRLRERLRHNENPDPQNRLTVPMLPLEPGDLVALPPLGSPDRRTLEEIGRAAIQRGELAVVFLAGGMATRFGGGVKAAAEVLDGLSFLAFQLRQVERVATACQAEIPVFLMSSFASDAQLRTLASSLHSGRVPVDIFPQFISLRLTPEGQLFRDAAGRLSPYAPGHGDLVPALSRAGLLATFARRGIKYLAMTNIDNLAGTLDPALLALHAGGGKEMSFEVVARDPSDQGGTPARVGGVLQVIEGLRQPPGFDPASIPWFSTNCLYFTVEALRPDFPLEWFAVSKQVDGRRAIQFERLVNQMTAFLPSRGLIVERDGPEGRFLPIKEPGDLQRERARIEQLVAERL
jgi:UTP--glucose-1-phosphate uridylyltransferase